MLISNPRPNPYVGPRSFQKGEKLYGRDRELRDLLDLLIAERIVLLYSPSGAGKTSLISAGLIPSLQEEGFHVLPIIRVNQEPPAGLSTHDPNRGDSEKLSTDAALVNRYLFSTLLSLEEELPQEEQTPVDQLARMGLSEYLESRPHTGEVDDLTDGRASPVLIFDQFEEVLTLDPTDQEGKIAFFSELGATLRDRNRWALFVVREDYVGALDPYLRPIPTRLNNRFRLDLLGVGPARQAIQQPVKEAGVDFTHDAVHKLVDDLRQIQLQRADGTMEIRPGLYVEPVQLQVVCYHLWQQLAPDRMEISEGDLSAIGSVDQSLAEYYAQQVFTIAEKADVKERNIRDWFEHHLITESGIRGQVLMEPEQSEGLANSAIRMLEDTHLIRSEKRLGATWFELAHDRLIMPVRSNNARWFQENLSLLQRQASLWEQQNRSDTLYLRDEALIDAEKWAEGHPDELSEVDGEFLEACVEVRTREEEARAAAERERQLKLEAAEKIAEEQRLRAEEQAKAASRLRRRAYILGAVLLVAIAMAVLAVNNQRVAVSNAQRADQQRSTAIAAGELASNNASTAEAASTQSYNNELLAKANEADANAASTVAVAQQITAEYNAKVADEQRANAIQQAALARSRELASLALSFLKSNSELTLLLSKEALNSADTGQALDSLLRGLQRNLSRTAEKFEQPIERQVVDIYTVAASPDGRTIAWGGSDGLIKVWDLAKREEAWFKIVTPGTTVYDMVFSPDGKTLVTGDSSGVIAFFDVENGDRVRTLLSNIPEVYALAYSPDGSTLAFAGKNQSTLPNLYTRNLDDNSVTTFRIREGEVSEILSIAWSPDGKLLASGGRDRIVHLWDPQTGLEVDNIKDRVVDTKLVRIFDGSIRRLAFSPNGKWLATGAEDVQGGVKDKTLLIWDTSAWTDQEPLVFRGPEADLSVLAFSPDGQTLVSGYENGEVLTWNFNTQQVNQTLKDHTRAVLGLDFAQFDESLLLVTSGLDRTIVLNNLIALKSLFEPLAQNKGNPTRLGVNLDDTILVAGNSPSGLVTGEIAPISKQENPVETGISYQGKDFYLSPDGNRLAFIAENGQIEVQELGGSGTFSISIPQVTVSNVDAAGNVSSVEEAPIVDSLAFNHDGDQLAGGMCSEVRRATDPESNAVIESCLNNEIRIWDVASGELLKQIPTNQPSAILSMAFSPIQENMMAAGYRNASIQLWDLEEERARGNPLVGSGGPVTSLAFHHDGDILASGSENNLIALFNMSPPQPVGDPLTGLDGSVTGLAFSHDSSTLYSGTDKGTILSWNLEAWKDIACELAKRNMTPTEWEQFFPGVERRATCEGISLETSTPTPTLSPSTPLAPGTPTPTP